MILWLIGRVSCMLTRSQLGIVWTQKDISLKEIIDNVASDFFQRISVATEHPYRNGLHE